MGMWQQREERTKEEDEEWLQGLSLSTCFLPSVKVMQPIRKAVRLLYHFPSFWRCVYLPEGVIQWTHPPTTIIAPGQARPTSPSDHQGRRGRQSAERPRNTNPLAMEIPHKLHSFPVLSFRSTVTDKHCRLRQSSSGSLSSEKERKGRGKKAWGRGRVLNLLRCLWKMNHGGLHRGRSRGETHLVKKEKEKNRTGKRAEKYISFRTIKRFV